jgi:TRAP-type mannitol/chloroaromatic compound transport system substrate-binding protein
MTRRKEDGMAMHRRRFLVKAGGTLAAAGGAALVRAPAAGAQPKIQWRMSTTWTSTLDVLQAAAQRLAGIVEEVSGGRFRIEVSPGGQQMGLFECFDAVAQGRIEAYMGSPQYWATKEPALEWFATIPFGMDPNGMAAWYYHGDGLKLMEEAYAPFNVVPRPAMGNAPQMAGWFRKRIGTIADLKGLKMRIPSLGGKVYARAGATTVLTPGSEIYAALERGVIDAAEWIGPHDDMQIGLHKTARFYYYPGWHEPGTTLDFGFARKAYDALPVDLRRLLDHAAASVQVYARAEHHARNAVALERLRTEFKGKVEVLAIPPPVLRDLRKLAAQVVHEESERTPMARKVHASFTKFQALVGPWDHVAEGAYHQYVAG